MKATLFPTTVCAAKLPSPNLKELHQRRAAQTNHTLTKNFGLSPEINFFSVINATQLVNQRISKKIQAQSRFKYSKNLLVRTHLGRSCT